MANYYELLKVSPSASAQEISSAFDTQYEQWRRLVTHHDPNVVNQANQALQLLEQIRATLSDPAKRAAYDEGIGLRSPMTPPAPRQMPGAAQPGSVAPTQPALWTCPKCAKENPPNTRFCFNCGTQLVRACPECGQETSLVATGFCGNCGYNYDVAAQRAKLKSEISSASSRVSHAASQLNEAHWPPHCSVSCPPLWLPLERLLLGKTFRPRKAPTLRTPNKRSTLLRHSATICSSNLINSPCVKRKRRKEYASWPPFTRFWGLNPMSTIPRSWRRSTSNMTIGVV
ncbi:MAG: hypothetical protein DCC52_13660 [Chloroflexi bacterium]|nr:MAG: hypothetical protein DCC52_13660 [Chloroflexota bacterium]